MKKYLSLLFLLAVCTTPVMANTVKQNNYSEELNTQVVDDYVNKRIRVNFSEVDLSNVDGINHDGKVTDEEFIIIKQQVIKELQGKMAYYNKYYTLKLQDLSNSLERAKATAYTR